MRGGESLTRQFTVKVRGQLDPGFSSACYIELRINYRAEFGANKDDNYILLGSYPVDVKSRELPLELKPNISAKPSYVKGFIYDNPAPALSGEIRIRNVQNWEIVLSRFRMCTWRGTPRDIMDCIQERDLTSSVVKSGEEYVIDITGQITVYSLRDRVGDMTFNRYIIFIIEYVTPNGKAQNWVLYKVSGRITRVTEETESPTKVATTRSPTETRTIVTTGTTRAETAGPVVVTTTGPAATGPSTDAFTLALILVPIAVAAATAAAFAVRWLRKAPT